jgi:hypothetical protein
MVRLIADYTIVETNIPDLVCDFGLSTPRVEAL